MLIVLEGLDGAGKSTQIAMLQGYLNKKSKNVQYLHFPRFNAPVFGDLIARYLRGELGSANEINPFLVALLFAGDRRDASEMIREWLKNGDYVILDRYVYSNIAFQCAKTEGEENAAALRSWILETEYGVYDIPKPDINLFLDVPISFVESKLGQKRKGDDRDYLKGKSDIHEANISYQVIVRQIYLNECMTGNDIQRIDCAGGSGEMLSAEEIHRIIIKKIEEAI